MHSYLKVERFITWLTFSPSLEKIVRTLVLDYLSAYNPIQAMIYHLNKDDSVTRLASYGANKSLTGIPIPESTWRNAPEDPSLNSYLSQNRSIAWSDNNKQVTIKLYAQSMLIGFLLLRFANSVVNPEEVGAEALALSWNISLYIGLRFLQEMEDDESSTERAMYATEKRRLTIPSLTERQGSILSGMTKKKTNIEIAHEMGYSVSTIRHETMRIFEVLGVSSRGEAAQQAIALGLS